MKTQITSIQLILLLSLNFSACDGRNNPSKNIPDTDPPQVMSTVPAQYSGSVHPDSAITFNFDEQIDPLSSEKAISLVCDGEILGITTQCQDTAVTVSPDVRMPLSASCNVIVSGLSDENGNTMEAPYTLTFTIMYLYQYRPALLWSISPVEGAVGIYPGELVKVFFYEDINPFTVTGSSFSVSNDQGVVAGTLVVSGNMITFTPSTPFAYGKEYTVTIRDTIASLTGRYFEHDYTWLFSTLGLIGREEILSFQEPQPNELLIHSADSGDTIIVWGEGGGGYYHNTSMKWIERPLGLDWGTPSLLLDASEDKILDYQFIGNKRGERFLLLRQLSGWWALRYDPQIGEWEEPVQLHDVPGYCSDNITCLGSEVSFTVGEDGSALLAFVEQSNPLDWRKMRVKRYSPDAGWQDVEDIATSSDSYLSTQKPPPNVIDSEGQAFIAWIRKPYGGSTYEHELVTSSFTKELGWSAPELVLNTTSYPGIELYSGAMILGSLGTPWLFWSQDSLLYFSTYNRTMGWQSNQVLGPGTYVATLFDSAANSMVLIKDTSTYSGSTMVIHFTLEEGLQTPYYLPVPGRFCCCFGDPSDRVVVIFSSHDHLWRIEYTPDGFWGEPEAVGPYAGFNYNLGADSSDITMLPDETILIGSVRSKQFGWELVVTSFH